MRGGRGGQFQRRGEKGLLGVLIMCVRGGGGYRFLSVLEGQCFELFAI
jgi:hypothetical protein